MVWGPLLFPGGEKLSLSFQYLVSQFWSQTIFPRIFERVCPFQTETRFVSPPLGKRLVGRMIAKGLGFTGCNTEPPYMKHPLRSCLHHPHGTLGVGGQAETTEQVAHAELSVLSSKVINCFLSSASIYKMWQGNCW